MQLENHFIEYWKKQFSFICPENNVLIVAISGGIDSIVLAHLLKQTSTPLVLAHCNFKLRNEESFRDEQFVSEFAKYHSLPLEIKQFETKEFAEINKISIQEAARKLRYQWFEELRLYYVSKNKTAFIATAHHANDNIETACLNFFRGTGIKGLTGIPEKNDFVIRPLLSFQKTDLLEYAKAHSLQFVEDSSNQSNKYSRNYIRNEFIPSLKNIYPEVEMNILQNIERFKDVLEIYNNQVEQLRKKIFIKKDKEFHIPIILLLKQKAYKTLLYEYLKDFNFTSSQIQEILKLVDADNGSYIASFTHRIIKNRKWLIVASLQQEQNSYFIIDANQKKIEATSFLITVEKSDSIEINSSSHTVSIDANKMQFPLIVRKWKEGDYFYPLGMKKKKKIARFLIDQKLSITEKENVWIVQSNQQIVWVINYRLDDRFKITPSTTKCVLLTVKH
jgi:tRNA(Ile)-lysidine synthase